MNPYFKIRRKRYIKQQSNLIRFIIFCKILSIWYECKKTTFYRHEKFNLYNPLTWIHILIMWIINTFKFATITSYKEIKKEIKLTVTKEND